MNAIPQAAGAPPSDPSGSGADASPESPDTDRPAARSATREWIYAQSVKGTYQKIHRWVGLVLQAILVMVPWISVGDHPAFQIDLAGRRLYIVGSVFTPRETIFLVLMLLFSAFTLFFFTALFGRLWCGYACPQTVFLEEWVRPIEKWVEGERGVRMARDRKGWTFDRAWRKVVKWTAFAAISAVVAMSFVSWFSGARPLWTGQAGAAAYIVAGVIGAFMFWDFAWFREQFCNFLCPYARFQGALCDEQSLVVAYDERRGEPRARGRARRTTTFSTTTLAPHLSPAAAGPLAFAPLMPAPTQPAPSKLAPPSAPQAGGSCIDCKKCVTVCPQGIDIREGFQLECITCGRCIDACTGVMEKLGEESLISYTQLNRGPFIRPRTVVYATLLAVIATLFVTLLANRHEIEANVGRLPGTLYIVDADGWIRNTYMVRVTNKHFEDEAFSISVEGLPPTAEVEATPFTLHGDEARTVPLIIRMPPGTLQGGLLPITVNVQSHDDRLSLPASFAGSS